MNFWKINYFCSSLRYWPRVILVSVCGSYSTKAVALLLGESRAYGSRHDYRTDSKFQWETVLLRIIPGIVSDAPIITLISHRTIILLPVYDHPPINQAVGVMRDISIWELGHHRMYGARGRLTFISLLSVFNCLSLESHLPRGYVVKHIVYKWLGALVVARSINHYK